MDRDAMHLWAFQFEAVLERRDHFVNALHRELIGQRAMAR
jgi:hypothetical protein